MMKTIFNRKPNEKCQKTDNEIDGQLKEKIEQKDNLIAHYRQEFERVTEKLSEIEKQMVNLTKQNEHLEFKFKDAEQRRINATAVAQRRLRKIEKLEA